MNIDVATEGDIEELTRVEIRSKKQSVPKCFEYHEMHYWSQAESLANILFRSITPLFKI
jgi:hypothetical protein